MLADMAGNQRTLLLSWMMRAEAKSQVRMETSVLASRFALPFLQRWLPAQAWSPVLQVLRVMQAWSTVEAR